MKKIVFISALLTACTGNQPNHIGNPLLLPSAAVSTGIQNSIYNHRRQKVANYVSKNTDNIRQNVSMGGGAHLTVAMDLANVPKEKENALISELNSNHRLYFSTDPEPLIVALMVHGP